MPHLLSLSEADKQQWLAYARYTILSQWANQLLPPSLPTSCPRVGCFVTLKKNHALRGCIGTLRPDKALNEAIAYFSIAAASHDPRFHPVTPDEFAQCKISISILSDKESIPADSRTVVSDHLVEGKTGLWLTDGLRTATFLPIVWEDLPQKDLFITQLLKKGGWNPNHWPSKMQAFIYEALEFSE